MTNFAERRQDVLGYAKRNRVRLYEIAHVIGCNDGNFSRKLRYMTTDDVKRYKSIVDQIVSERGEDSAEG